ncbi:MAG: PfkB family carbohydrate kinase, partial [Hyphomicrobiales bacterium]
VIGRVTFMKMGGVTTYAGLTYRRHGLPTWVVSRVAHAETWILKRLAAEGIQVSDDPAETTTRFVNRVRAGRRHQVITSIAPSVNYSQLAAVEPQVDCIHLGPLHPKDIDESVFVGLRESRALVVLDVQGLVREISGSRVAAAVSEHLDAALRAAFLVKSDEDELRLILETFGTRVEDLMIRFEIAEWVVTSGFNGGRIYSGNASVYRYSSEPVSLVVDSTGAGDVFLAAYTVARFKNHQTVARASRYAAKLAASHVSGQYLPHVLAVPRRRTAIRRPSGWYCVDNRINEG